MLGGGLSLLLSQVREGVGLGDLGDASRLLQRHTRKAMTVPHLSSIRQQKSNKIKIRE